MSTVIYTKTPLSDELYFHHVGMDVYLGRVVAGIGWPSEKPGGVVVVGEELSLHPRGKHKMYLLAEAEEADTGNLLARCLEFQSDLKVQFFYGALDLSTQAFLLHFNRKARKDRKPDLFVSQTPYFQENVIAYHLNVLKDQLRSDNKMLLLNENSCLPGLLGELPIAIASVTDKDYPLLTALAFAVTALVSMPFVRDDGSDMAEMKYDLFKR